MCAKFQAYSIICSKVIRGSQNFEFWSRNIDRAKFGGQFGLRTQEGSVLHKRAKFEADSIIHSKVIRGVPKFRILVT